MGKSGRKVVSIRFATKLFLGRWIGNGATRSDMEIYTGPEYDSKLLFPPNTEKYEKKVTLFRCATKSFVLWNMGREGLKVSNK